MIKHPENCGINHGSRCSCGMSELQAECDRLKEENSKQLDFIDLMQDEFQRIRTISVHPEYGNSEIEGLCERAIKNTEQHIPVIKQRDDAQKALLAFRLDNDKWKSIADRLAEVVDKEYINMDDVNTAYEALKSYNAVKGE